MKTWEPKVIEGGRKDGPSSKSDFDAVTDPNGNIDFSKFEFPKDRVIIDGVAYIREDVAMSQAGYWDYAKETVPHNYDL